MADEFPINKIKTTSLSNHIHVGRNTTAYRCPYSQDYLPKDYVAIAVGQNNKEICFDPKHFNEFLQEINEDLSDEQISPNIHHTIDSNKECICCSTEGDGLFIEIEYYISCDITDRQSELSITQEYGSYKEEKSLFLCYDCISSIESYFPNNEVKSVVASHTV